MKILVYILAILLIISSLLTGYVIYTEFFYEESKFEQFVPPNSFPEIEGQYQIHPFMRYQNKTISYSIINPCPQNMKEQINSAFNILQENTILTFYEKEEDGEIKIYCFEDPINLNKKQNIAGEGRPTITINTTKFALILEGEANIYGEGSCEKPIVIIHEILHTLGFDHQNNTKSALYPIADCSQELTGDIVKIIDELYLIESLPDLVIEEIIAVKTGRYLNFEITISNQGLRTINEFTLYLESEERVIKEFPQESLEAGRKRIFTVENLKIPLNAENIEFNLNSDEKELSYSENNARISVIE